MIQYINSFKDHIKARYGEPVGKVPLDAGMTCPNRKRGGCIYCSFKSYKPFYLQRNDPISLQLIKGKAFLNKKGFKSYFAYFQQETTTAVPLKDLIEKFREPLADSSCKGLIISTRPDYIQLDLLEYLETCIKKRSMQVLIEIGLQSTHDSTLQKLNRNHTYENFVDAVNIIQTFKSIELGVHLILGLPGEGFEDMRNTVITIGKLGLNYIKFHHLQIIRNTKLHELYNTKPFKTFRPYEYFELLAILLCHLPKEMVVHRLWSTSGSDILVEPRWNLPSYKLNKLLLQIMNDRGLYQGKYF